MTRRGLALARQIAAAAVLAALALSLTGDRTSAAGVPAPIYGQDPLEVLSLKVKPNVFLVFDSSSSMSNTLKSGHEMVSGDHPRSRNNQGKRAISDVVRANQDVVSFMFATYSGYQPRFYNGDAGYLRFQYYLDSSIPSFAFMRTAELVVRGAVGDTLGRGLQSWQIVQPAWSRLYFGEGTGALCYATVPGAPRFYARGSALAADLQAAMNAPTCTVGARQNTYTVTYTPGSGVFNFSRGATAVTTFQIRWADTPDSIAGALGRKGAANTSLSTSTVASGAPYALLYRQTGTGMGPSPFLGGMATLWQFTEAIPPGSPNNVTFYQLGAGRLWNGETIRVTPTGEACAMTFAAPLGPGVKTTPASVVVAAADAACVATGNQATFTFGGGEFAGTNSAGFGGCGGVRTRSDLVPCDLRTPPAPLQFSLIGPLLEDELPLDPASGNPKDFTTNDATGLPGGANYLVPDGIPDYVEDPDGSWATALTPFDLTTSRRGPTQALLQATVKIRSGTPIANTLMDIKGTPNPADNTCVVSVDPVTDKPTVGPCPERGFTKLWNQGQAGTTNMAGPPPWKLDAIANHKNPKEKTIVLFVTDGGDSCGDVGEVRLPPPPLPADGFTDNQRRAAYYAAELYRPIDPNETASSVMTYMIGYGGGVTGLDWIAWGGSGLGQDKTGQAAVDFWSKSTSAELTAARATCTTCVDAYIAPDAETLKSQLQSIIDQGASEGEFNAQQSITESVFEYVDLALAATSGGDAAMPTERYRGIVPTRFVSSFKLPGFKGQLRAFQNVGPALDPDPCDGTGQCKWEAGAKLRAQIVAGMGTCLNGECTLSALHGGATDAIVATSGAKIKRRIYTTTRNGVYTFSPTTLMAGTSAERVALWPPAAGVLPGANDYSNTGTFDAAMGLPPNSPTAYPPGCGAPKTYDQCWLEKLQKDFKACLGSSLPSGCTSTTVNTKMRAARREARDIVLAFMAGATPVPDPVGGWKRASSGPDRQQILFKARDWMLADSELATAAVVAQPSLSEPEATRYVAEYKLYRDGTRSGGKNVDPAGDQIRQGFGLTQPDNDHTVGLGEPDTRVAVKPVMTVVYAPANDMLHAFRAGPCDTPSLDSPACAEKGGEELWGFVPYDQLRALALRVANDPQGRENHVYMLARGLRFADVFVPGAMTNKSIGNVTVPSMQGVWRRIMYFGRGIGGKYVTALDVTAPGPYTATALSTTPPIPLWSRGNPDTQDGLPTGAANGTAGDTGWYRKMGETWSIPTVAFVNPDKANALYVTPRRPDGVDFVLFMGSGYGDPATYGNEATREGTTHYTLDALSGDVVAAVDVERTAADNGLTRTGLAYPNAIVANSVSFNRSSFSSVSAKVFNVNPHPWAFVSARVYVGDVHGRLWKFLTEFPGTAIPAADLGSDQPIGTAVALLGQDVDPLNPNPATMIPNIFATTGNDRRAAGPFRNFSILDEGVDTDVATTGTTSYSSPIDGATFTTFLPVKPQFTRTFDPGDPEADCGYTTEAVFRGTIQPTSAVECDGQLTGSKCDGALLQRVFYGGTRLSLPNTRFAPPTPLSCSLGDYPCRSQFDSVLYALGVKSGLAAYDLNAAGDDAYRIFRDSRIAAIFFQADPEPGRGGSRFGVDEGLMKGVPKPPPPPGIPPTTTSATASVVLRRVPGQPAPVVQYGSTVCQ